VTGAGEAYHPRIVRLLVPAALLLLTSPAAGAGPIDVRVSGDRLTIHARAAALADVLAQVASRTGMKVVYDGRPPRSPVTVTIDDAAPAEAILRVLEGLGINYALAMDREGRRVETLIVSGGEADKPGAAAPSGVSLRSPLRPPAGTVVGAPVEPDEDDETDQEVENAVAAAKDAKVKPDDEDEDDDEEAEAEPAPAPSPAATPLAPRFPGPRPSPSASPR
jgi:hypothetical protein